MTTKIALGFAAAVLFASTSAFAGSFDIKKPSKPEPVKPAVQAKGVVVNTNSGNVADVSAVQLTLGAGIKDVKGDVAVLENQGVGSNLDVEVSQVAAKVNSNSFNSGDTAALQVTGVVGIAKVGGNVKALANTAVGSNASVKINK